MTKKTSSNAMWGGRFDERPDDLMAQINASIDIDKRLYRQDIAGSKAHARMLVAQKIITKKDGDAIQKGLDLILGEIESGALAFTRDLEDIHMNIESRLKALIGDAAGRLHTGRSRNDQVATDFRLWVREACDAAIARIGGFQKTLKALCRDHRKTIMPGFTHLQVAQPVTLALHLGATWEMLERDKSRFQDCRRRMNKSPLGAAALAGTPYPIDRNATAAALGFDAPMANTMDAVSARDFATEFLFACAQCGLNLSRLAEEIILWTTPQFGFMRLADKWSTGSSIMPQKKNPDAAELVRAKTGRLNGNLIQLMTVMKALPLTYNKDMQEDKQAVFESFDTLVLCLSAMEGMIATATWDKNAMRDAADSGFATATALADWLVMELGMPFRDAHHVTGRIVKMAETKGCKLQDLSLPELQKAESKITKAIYDVLSPESSVKRHQT